MYRNITNDVNAWSISKTPGKGPKSFNDKKSEHNTYMHKDGCESLGGKQRTGGGEETQCRRTRKVEKVRQKRPGNQIRVYRSYAARNDMSL